MLTWRHSCSAKLKINDLKILSICRLESALIDHPINLLTVRFTAHQQENTKGHTLWSKIALQVFFYCFPWLKMKCPGSQKPYLPINKEKILQKPGLRTTFYCYQRLYHQSMVQTTVPSSDCKGSSGCRSHSEKNKGNNFLSRKS